MTSYGLSDYDAEVLTGSRELADYFENCLKDFKQPKPVSNWITGPLLGLLNAQAKDISHTPISAQRLAELLQLIADGTISNKMAKTVFDEMAASGKPAPKIVADKGLVQVTDAGTIDAVVRKVLSRSEKEVSAYRKGKTQLMGFFVGQVMRETKGKANPQIVNEILRAKLAGE